jgi:hypothetical protein
MYPVFSIRESDSFVNIDARSDASELHAMLTDIDGGHILRECLSCGIGATCGPTPPRAPTVHDAGPSNQTPFGCACGEALATATAFRIE